MSKDTVKALEAKIEELLAVLSEEDNEFRQLALAAWQVKNFGAGVTLDDLLFGVFEEAGEVAHARLKGSQGIRIGVDPAAAEDAIKDGLCDVMVFCVQALTRLGVDASTEYNKVVDTVLARNWKDNPSGAGYSQHKE